MYFHNPMEDNDASGAWPVWIPGAWLVEFMVMKRTAVHCYTQNMEVLGLVVSEKTIFTCLSNCKSMGGWGHFRPKGQDSQDLCKAPHNAAYQI